MNQSQTELFPTYINLQPQRRYNYPRWKKVLHKLNLFAFVPYPKSYPVSTPQSVIGTFVISLIFITFIIYSFVDFLFNNVPKMKQFTQQDQKHQNTTAPNIAIQFLYGQPLNVSITSTSYFSITMQEIVKFLDPTQEDISKSISLQTCYSQDLDWMPKNANNLEYFCPIQQLNMSGQLYNTETFIYPRIYGKIKLQFFNLFYKLISAIINILIVGVNRKMKQKKQQLSYLKISAGGRLLLYMENKESDINYITVESLKSVPYKVFQYFLVPGLYNRAEIILEKQEVTITADYFTSFKDIELEYLEIKDELLYVSNVTENDLNKTINQSLSLYKGFQVQFRTDENTRIIYVAKTTIIDVLAKLGACWSVLFFLFRFILIKYNTKIFYQKNQDWAVFDS